MQFIHGLKAALDAAELADLCTKRAAHHRERAEHYRNELQAAREQPYYDQATQGPYGGTTRNVDPVRDAISKVQEHEKLAIELDFLAAHVLDEATYVLDRHEYARLGISAPGF